MARTSTWSAAVAGLAFASTNVLGAAPVQDLTTRLLSDSPSGIRSAAREVHRAGHADPATLDLMAEILSRNATQPDELFADAGAWLCLALGKAGGPRYFEVMQSVATNDAVDSKIAEHCEDAIEHWPPPSVPQYRAGTIDLALRKSQVPASAATALNVDARQRLLSGDFRAARAAAKKIFVDKGADRETLDVMAELLLQNAPLPDDDAFRTDASAWMCLALGRSEDRRYYQVLKQVATNEAVPDKVAEACEKVVEKWEPTAAEQYQRGSVDLAQKTAEVRAIGPSQDNLEAIQPFLSADAGTIRAAAIRALGKNNDPVVHDAMAEVLLQHVERGVPPSHEDALAWVCKALGHRGGPRYYAAVQRAATQGGKLGLHCAAALEELEKPSGEQYARGMTDLARLKQAYVPPPVVAEARAPAASVATASAAAAAPPPPPPSSALYEDAPAAPVVLVLGPPGVPADQPLYEYGHNTPRPIPGGHGAFSSPFTEDGTVAPWIAKAMTVKAGSALGSTVGGYAGQYAADKAMEQAGAFIPGLSLLGNMFGKKAGEAVGRKAAIEAAGGWDYIKSTSDISFRSVNDMARFIVIRNQAHPDFMKVVETATSVYPDLQQAVFRNLR